MAGGPLSVAVLSRYALVRMGLTGLVHADQARAVVVEAAAHDGHLSGLDVVIYDLAGLAARQSTGDLRHLLGSVPVVGLARDARADLTEGARTLGVRHTVPEDVSSEQLLDTLELAVGRSGPREARDPMALTPRERDVLRLVGSGLSNHQIAAELFVSLNTVKTYVRTAYRKIGVTKRSEAVLWAVRRGLVTPERAAPPRSSTAP